MTRAWTRRRFVQAGGAIGVTLADDLAATVGNAGSAQGGLALANALDVASPGDVIALVSLADGVDVLLFRATEALADARPARSIAAQCAARANVPYAKFLAWRDVLTVQPPNRPTPPRPTRPSCPPRAPAAT